MKQQVTIRNYRPGDLEAGPVGVVQVDPAGHGQVQQRRRGEPAVLEFTTIERHALHDVQTRSNEPVTHGIDLPGAAHFVAERVFTGLRGAGEEHGALEASGHDRPPPLQARQGFQPDHVAALGQVAALDAKRVGRDPVHLTLEQQVYPLAQRGSRRAEQVRTQP